MNSLSPTSPIHSPKSILKKEPPKLSFVQSIFQSVFSLGGFFETGDLDFVCRRIRIKEALETTYFDKDCPPALLKDKLSGMGMRFVNSSDSLSESE